MVCMMYARMPSEHLTHPYKIKNERAGTHSCQDKHTHTETYTLLDSLRLLAGSHYVELWDDMGMESVCCVCLFACVCVKGVSVKGCLDGGRLFPNESPRSEALSLTAANFT